MDNKRTGFDILWLTRSAILIALLIVVQSVTAPMGNQILTGSLVNMILVISSIVSGLSSGLAVAIISPIMAKFFNIGPLWTLIPFIALGNAVLVVVWHLIAGRKNIINPRRAGLVAIPVAAVAKFVTLYIGIVKIAVPILLKLPAPQAEKISAIFSIPQLITALIGGAIAFLILPVLRNAVKR